MEISAGKGDTLTILHNRKKYVFKFTSNNMKTLCYDMIITLIAGKGKSPSMEEQMRTLINYLPNPTNDDWKSLLETARLFSSEKNTQEEKSSDSELTNHTFHAEYSFGDVITAQGQPHNRLIRIISGSCTCIRTFTRDGSTEETRQIRDIGMDDLAGIVGFFCPDTSYYSLVAHEADVKVLEISRDFIQTILFAQNPQAVVRFYNLFCRTLAQRVIRNIVSCKNEFS